MASKGHLGGMFGVAGLFFVSVVAVLSRFVTQISTSVKIYRPTHQKGNVTIG